MNYEWDDANRHHIALHRITPHEVEEVLENDPYDLERLVIFGEERFSQLGETKAGRILVVVVTWRLDVIRAVTAWDAPPYLKRKYFAAKTNRWTPYS